MNEVDAVLVGASAGSLLAAILLTERGMSPLIVEKSDRVGGGTAYSGGIVWAPDNQRMRAKGQSDSAVEGMRYLDAISGGRADTAIARRYVDEVSRALETVERTTGLRWVTYVGLPDYYAEAPGGKREGRCVMPLPVEKSPGLVEAWRTRSEMSLVRPALHAPGQEQDWIWGRAVVGALWARVLELGVPYRLSTPVRELVVESGRVTGVRVDGPAGSETIGARRGVLLNTGGFEWNEQMSDAFLPAPLPHPHTPPSNSGDGHRMAGRAGAAMELMDRSIRITSIHVGGRTNDGQDLYQVFFQPLCLPHSMVVNGQGRRFANETFFEDVVAAWDERDPDGSWTHLPSWMIFDHQYVEAYGMPGGLSVGANVTVHDSLEDLAVHHGIDAGGLVAQATEFSAMARDGYDGAHRRGTRAYHRAFGDPQMLPNPTLGSVEKPPFFAARIHPSTSGHRGGARIDADGRVLRDDGGPIDGLFACGNAAAGTVTGRSYITGVTLGHTLTFGMLAAEAMAATART